MWGHRVRAVGGACVWCNVGTVVVVGGLDRRLWLGRAVVVVPWSWSFLVNGSASRSFRSEGKVSGSWVSTVRSGGAGTSLGTTSSLVFTKGLEKGLLTSELVVLGDVPVGASVVAVGGLYHRSQLGRAAVEVSWAWSCLGTVVASRSVRGESKPVGPWVLTVRPGGTGS
jgi:hypothetical protein